MKRIIAFLPVLFLMLFSLPTDVKAQNEKKVEKKVEKKIVEKGHHDLDGKKEVQQIIIRKKGDKDEKITIEINGDDVKINGKPAKDYDAEELKITMQKFKDFENLRGMAPRGNFNWDDNGFQFFSENENKAMLGVSTEKSATGGVEIKEVVKESAAEKAGLKKGDLITKVDDKKIENPDDLTKAIGDHKPGDKVVVTILRDKKEQKVDAELGKWKGMNMSELRAFSDNMPDLRILEEMAPRLRSMPRVPGAPRAELWMMENKPKLGLSIQDTEDGKGVKVIEVESEGNAGKAGIKKDDLITHINDKAVSNAEEVARIVRENKEGSSLMIKLLRSGKVQNFEVKIPKKLKTVEL